MSIGRFRRCSQLWRRQGFSPYEVSFHAVAGVRTRAGHVMLGWVEAS